MKRYLIVLLLLTISLARAQYSLPEPYLFHPDSLNEKNTIPEKHWQFFYTTSEKVAFPEVLKPKYDEKFNQGRKHVTSFGNSYYAWVRYRLKNTTPDSHIITFPVSRGQEDYYISEGPGTKWLHFTNGDDVPWSRRDGLKDITSIRYTLKPNQEVTIFIDLGSISFMNDMTPQIADYNSEVENKYVARHHYERNDVMAFGFFGFVLFAMIFNLFFYFVNRERVYMVYSFLLFFSAMLLAHNVFLSVLFDECRWIYPYFMGISIVGFIVMLINTVRYFFRIAVHFPGWDKFMYYCSYGITVFGLLITVALGSGWYIFLFTLGAIMSLFGVAFIISFIVMIISLLRKKDKEARLFVIGATPFALSPFIAIFIEADWLITSFGMWTILVLSWGMFARFKSLQVANARIALEKEEERSRLIAEQNELLEKQVNERTAELKQSIDDLKLTQKQLVQSEKMASLGELTAGIAHEIQNPLNFVNNFSEVSIELLEEMEQEAAKGDIGEVRAISGDIRQNLEKIVHHGKRADNIVKGMLQHSRQSTGHKESTDVNALADEYFRLAYHGLRAKDKGFNATLKTDFDTTLPELELLPQDFGRVLLNLFTNAFYSVRQKQLSAPDGYQPTVSVATLRRDGFLDIKVKDNGMGIPAAIKDKILQPFFTTKPTGEGTGLGLSLSYDIIVKGHGGNIAIDSTEGEGAEFTISVPLS